MLELIWQFTQGSLRRKAQEEHIRAWIDGAQGAIDLEAVGLRINVEALRDDGLKDVARPDVLLGALDGGQEVLFSGAMAHLQRAFGFVRCQPGQRLGEALFQPVEPGDGLVVCVGGLAARHVGGGH